MSDGRLNFKATIDDSDFNRKLSNMEKGVGGLSFENSTKSLDSLNKKLLETKQRLQDSKNELVRLNAQIASTAPGNIKNNLLIERNALRRSINEDKAAVVGYKQEITNLNRELKKTSEGGNTLKGTLSSLKSYFGALIGIGTVISLLRSFYDTTKQLDVLNKSMELGAKDSQSYASNMAFLKNITEQYGLELISTSQAYNKFYIAAKNKLALEDIQLIFEKISKSASLMGLSVADQAGIFRALEQMMSKGTVQAEELRMQLGDRLPGAFEIMARSMGVTTEKLGEMMKDGEVITSEVLPKFAIELEKTFGADKVDTIDNLTAAENRLKNAWTDFVAEINGSENIIGKVLMAFADGIADLIKDISRLTTSWKRLYQIAGQKGAQEGYNSVMPRADRVSQGEATKNAFRLENDLRKLNKERKDLEEAIASETGLDNRNRMKEKLEELSGTIGNVTGQLAAYREIAFGLNKDEEEIAKNTGKTDKEALKRLEELAKKRIAFVLELEKAERNLTQSTLSGLDLEKAKIEEVYQERLKKAKELKANQDALDKIESLKVKETEIVTYKAETESIKIALEQQKKDYEDFENFKKQVGVDKATEMYKDLIDVNKTYMQSLEDEMSKIDLSKATDLEKDRYNTLFKLYQDYNFQKNEEERKYIENMVSQTMTAADKLKVLYENYQRDLSKLASKYSGERLKEEERKLYEVFATESNRLSSELLENADEFQMALDVIGTSTRRQAQYQIDSLNKLLDGTNKLTNSQVRAIKKTIGELNKALISSDVNDQNGRIGQIQKQIIDTENEINRLQRIIDESSKKDYETAEQFATRMKLISDSILVYKERLEGLKQDKFLATIEEISNLSSGFESLGDSLGVFDENLGNAFKTIGNILKVVGQVGKLIEAVGAGVRSAGEGSGSPWVAIVGAVVQIAGVVTQMIAEGKKAREQARAEHRAFYRNLTTAEYEYQQLIRQRRLAAIEGNQDISPYENLKQQEEELQRQLIDSAKEYQELMNTILSEGRFITDVERDKKKNKNIYSDLKGITGDINEQYDELERLFMQGRLEGDTLAWFEALKKSKEELEALGYTLEDVQRMQDEMITGTTWQQLSSQIADMFANGTNSAVEFGNKLEDIIRNAIVSGFKARFIDQAMQELFDTLAGFANDKEGLTPSEIDEFNRLAQEAIGGLNNQWQQLIDGLDIDFGQEELGGQSAKDGIKRITESQADRLTGILTGMQTDVIASRQILITSRNLLNSSLDNLVLIEVNTRRTYEGIERIETILQNNQQQSLGL